MIWGKIIGVLIGFKLGLLPGAVAGLILGAWVDYKLAQQRRARRGIPLTRPRGVDQSRSFTVAVVNLAAKLAKVDGVVVRAEVDAFKALFNIPPSQLSSVGRLYDEAKRSPAGYEQHARTLAEMFGSAPLMLAGILDALHHIALADGPLRPAERAFLQRVAGIFGFGNYSFSTDRPRVEESDPYAVLGVARTASLDDIKMAWRRLTREHHPDSLMAKGMPQEMIDMATHKMAEINAAYDSIRRERGED